MSRFSNNHHFCAGAEDVIAEVEGQLWAVPDVVDVAIRAADELAPDAWLDAPDGCFARCWLVREADGWTELFGSWGDHDEALVGAVAERLACDALYGHNNDQVDNWRWIRFRAGQREAEYWYLGQAWVRFPDRHSPEADTLGQAFRRLGRTYHHESFSSALAQAPPTSRVIRRVVRE